MGGGAGLVRTCNSVASDEGRTHTMMPVVVAVVVALPGQALSETISLSSWTILGVQIYWDGGFGIPTECQMQIDITTADLDIIRLSGSDVLKNLKESVTEGSAQQVLASTFPPIQRKCSQESVETPSPYWRGKIESYPSAGARSRLHHAQSNGPCTCQ